MEKLSILEILTIDNKKNYKNIPLEKSIKAYNDAFDSPNVKIFRSGNSLLFLEEMKSGELEFHFVNADRFDDFVLNVNKIFSKLKEIGVNTMSTFFTNPRIIDVANTCNVDYDVIKKDNNDYIMIVRL